MLRPSTISATYLRVAVLLALLAEGLASQDSAEPRLQIAFVADTGDAIANELQAALKDAGMRTRRIAPKHCHRESWWHADAVVIAWPKDLPIASRTPLERWDRPTVFVGDTGDRFAEHWDLPTGDQITAWLCNASPELERRRFEGSNAWHSRQGNLIHLAKLQPKEKALWLASSVKAVRWASHFQSDRAMLRTARDKKDVEVERERVRRLHAIATELDVDVTSKKSLLGVPNMLLGSDQEHAEQLLVDVFPEGPGAGATRNDWMNWIKARPTSLYWDHATEIWHDDKLAHSRRHKGRNMLRDRADGLHRDPRAIAIASKVVAFHGGRALDDLRTYSVRRRNYCLMWDRQRGYFRIENHTAKAPAAAAAPWRVSAIDTATAEQIVWDRKRPTPGKDMFLALIDLTFLPLMLLDPGVTLRYIEAESNDEAVVLSVQMPGRNMDLAIDYRLTVDRATGAMRRLHIPASGIGGRVYVLLETSTCGPLRLPSSWRIGDAPNGTVITDSAMQWNPTLPKGLTTSQQLLSEPPGK